MDQKKLYVEEILKNLNTDKEKGLNLREVRIRREKFGKNLLNDPKKSNFLKKILEQFSDFMVITLFIAAGISFIVSFINKNNDYVDSIIILTIVIFNAIIGVVQENQAQKAIDSLKKLSVSKAKVIRDGREQNICSEDIVPGDILVLETGDKVCADARIIKSRELYAEESILTGESVPVSKNENGKENMIFTASFITSGRAVAVVTETGMNTQIGKIAGMINRGQPPQTPLQIRLSETGKSLSIITIVICVIIFILGLFQRLQPLEMFIIAISLAVAAIPEGLPMIVTIALASGVKNMAKKHAIVRRLPAVETLGGATIICTDKTGTLTQNKMTVTEICGIKKNLPFGGSQAEEILSYAAICNNAKQKGTNIFGEPTEKALLEAAIKIGKEKTKLEKIFIRVKEVPFDPVKKIMTTVHKTKIGYKTIVKGAPDVLLKMCSYYIGDSEPKKNIEFNNKVCLMDDCIRKQIKKNYESMASRALRVLAIAYKDNNNQDLSENNLVFTGLIGITDPPRPEAKQAVKECLEAGIKPVMVTGDHVLTAKAIAKELGIMSSENSIITGKELNEIEQKTLEKNIFSYSVFARVSPEHKVKIVKAFQSKGAVVAMSGDGVNDAPALRVSDIGCAMGLSGTDVAKSASDMIFTDDNFSSIVEAIRQGRGIYDNIKKTVHFLISTNIGEIILVFLAFLMHLPTPLLAIQLLWINFVTDSFPALALVMEPVEKGIMKRKPINSKKSLISGRFGYNMVIEGCFIGVIAIIAFILGIKLFDSNSLDPISGRTMAFVTLGLSQLAHVFNVRSEKSIFKTNIFGNIKLIWATFFCVFLQIIVTIVPQFNTLFKTECMNFSQWMIVLPLSLLPIAIAEIEKFLARVNEKFCFGFKCGIKNENSSKRNQRSTVS
ncbi:MAG: calcium-translocating P-type ATPase, PMCA-type [Oscillospiraceae bacterium]|nr:calcium-translocating P-type ATPase, PMCA-type [Oscillospiraceae bacterium]